MAQYKRSDFELMAPAGSRESLAAAIAGGADSVYFGVGRLNMRAHAAGNLMAEEVPEIMGIVHGAGKKGYLTVNTVIYDEEIGEMESLVDAAVTAGVDAVIASDMAVVLACRKRGMPRASFNAAQYLQRRSIGLLRAVGGRGGARARAHPHADRGHCPGCSNAAHYGAFGARPCG